MDLLRNIIIRKKRKNIQDWTILDAQFSSVSMLLTDITLFGIIGLGI